MISVGLIYMLEMQSHVSSLSPGCWVWSAYCS